MGRRVQVCGTPTAIALDTERDGGDFKRGCVLHTEANNVVLQSGGNSLRVVDAQRFCAGSMDVRHVVKLPHNVKFSRNCSGKYGVAWENRQQDGGKESDTIYIVDFQSGEVAAKMLPSFKEQIADVFVDANGEQVVVVGAMTEKLYGWSRNDWEYNDKSETWSQAEWRIVDRTVVDTTDTPADTCSCGRFVSSAVMGNCFVYLRARQESITSVIVEKWIFDVDARWAPVSYSSRTMGASASSADSVEGLALFMTEKWKFAMLTVGSTLYHFQVDQDLRNSLVKRLALDHQVLDGTWINQDAALAMLLANGQISIASVSGAEFFELLSIESSSTMSKRLSLSALLGKALSAALQLVWIAQERQIVVDFGASCAAFKLEIVDEDDDSKKSIELLARDAFAQCERRVLVRLGKKPPDFGEYIRELVEGKSSPSPNELLHVTRIALTQSREALEESYFMLICIIHQQLAGYSVNSGNSRDPIDCVGKSLKLMEVLVSFTISMEGVVLRQISSRILSALQGCATKSDRKVYYRKEIAAILQQVQKLLSGVSECEDWWVCSTEATAFLRVYYTTTCSLLEEINSSSKLKPGEASQIISLCQRIIEHEDGPLAVDSIVKSEKTNGPFVERLKGLFASYTIISCCLGVHGVMIDLEHYFSLVSPPNLKRKEMLCCFLKPSMFLADDTRPVIAETKSAFNQAVRFATNADAVHLFVSFCTASGSLVADSCVNAVCNAVATCGMVTKESENALPVDNLHWQTCETYIGEAMAILHQIGVCRPFKYSNREVECSTGCLSVAIGDQFVDYHRCLAAALARTKTKYRVVSNKSSLWEFSHLDKRLHARMIYLISRIVRHLEATGENISSVFHCAFAMDLFNGQSEEREKLHDCIAKVREITNPVESDLNLPKFRRKEDSLPELPFRSQRIGRSLVLVAWALWLREKAANCSRGAHIGKMKDETYETKTFGALAATCALHLNDLRIVFGDSEDLLSIQLSLLGDAAKMNPSKTAAAIAWGFQPRKILTRYLKRYKSLRQAVLSSTDMSLEESEPHFQQLQKDARSAFRRIQGKIQNGESTHYYNSDIDALVDCCCVPEILQLMSTLAKFSSEVVFANKSALKNSQREIRTLVRESTGDSHDNVENVLPVNPDHEQTSATKLDQVEEPPVIESLISRDEVIALLQAQTRHLEEKIHAVTGISKPSSSNEDIQEVQTGETLQVSGQHKKRATSEKIPEKIDGTSGTAVNLADIQRMARISLRVRDMSRHRYSAANHKSDKQSNPLLKPVQRHDSVRNALKLFRLRQENCGRAASEHGDSTSANENGTPNVGNSVISALDVKVSRDTRSPAAVSPRRDKLKCVGVKTRSSRNQHSSESRGFQPKEPVFPLRLEYGIDNADLKLLGRNSQQRNPSVKKRQFIHQEREYPQNAYAPKPTTMCVEPTEVIQLKTVSAQTNDSVEATIPVVSAPTETKEPQNEIGPEKASPVAQECNNGKPISVAANTTNYSQKGVGIQCRVTENGQTNGARRKRGPPPLSIADKYPIWADLEGASKIRGSSHFKKFLQVARFGNPDHTTNNDATEDSMLVTVSPSVSTICVRREMNLEDGNDQNQSDGQPSPSLSTCNSQAQDGHTAEQLDDEIKSRYRAAYREHYPDRERSSRRRGGDQDGTNGINSLIDLRNNMQRMTQRLRELETCANSIDEEFKVSQKRLSRIGDTRPSGTSSQSRVLEDIDEVLERTEEKGSHDGTRKPKGGLLSKKALSDLDTAKKLLETIEQLTISTDD